jgi:hypothetical protein
LSNHSSIIAFSVLQYRAYILLVLHCPTFGPHLEGLMFMFNVSLCISHVYQPFIVG